MSWLSFWGVAERLASVTGHPEPPRKADALMTLALAGKEQG